MPHRFQFSLGRLFAATGLAAAAIGTYLAATRCGPPWNLGILVIACGVCGAAIGSLFRRTPMGAACGLAAGVGLVGYMISTADL